MLRFSSTLAWVNNHRLGVYNVLAEWEIQHFETL